MELNHTTFQLETLLVPSVRHKPEDVEALARSMGHNGQRDPIVVAVDPLPRVLSGTRRVHAARKLGWQIIDAVVVETLVEAAEVMATEHNDARVPLVATEIAVVLSELRRLPIGLGDAEIAAQRGFLKAQANLLGEALGGMNHTRVRRLLTTWDMCRDESLPRDTRFAAADALKAMNTRGIHPPYEDLMAKVGLNKRVPHIRHGVSEAQTRSQQQLKTVAEQRIALKRLVASVENLAVAIDYIGNLNPEFPPEELTALVQSLMRARSPLTSLINALRRIENGKQVS